MDQESFMIITVQGSSGPLPSHSRPSETRNKKLEESLFVTKRFIKQENQMTVVGHGPPISCYGCHDFLAPSGAQGVAICVRLSVLTPQ